MRIRAVGSFRNKGNMHIRQSPSSSLQPLLHDEGENLVRGSIGYRVGSPSLICGKILKLVGKPGYNYNKFNWI